MEAVARKPCERPLKFESKSKIVSMHDKMGGVVFFKQKHMYMYNFLDDHLCIFQMCRKSFDELSMYENY